LKTEIKILLGQEVSNKAKGNCFEDLVRNLLSALNYKVRGNIRRTGMEIDAVAEHKHRNNETVYVECKAKEKVSSIELRTFFANVFHNSADFGYFFRTNELEFDAGGLLTEMKADDRYKNLSFFEPEDIINMLIDSNMLFETKASLTKYNIGKKILAVTYFGDYFIYLINDSLAPLPTTFLCINATDNSKKVNDETIEKLKNEINELKSLNVIESIENESINVVKYIPQLSVETISEVQESDNWYDYLPASSTKNHFVGRDAIRNSILEYFKEIQNNTTSKRVFYLNGKSGWGKSSLVLEIKGRCKNKYYKNKFFPLAIDTRSALSDNFVALSFERLINQSLQENFIKKFVPSQPLNFTSTTDLLSSDSVNEILDKLKDEGKYLVIIFDQFEDVFRKQDLFKTFYKFLSDVTSRKPNIVVGFSWKSEFFIPNDDPAYFYWQNAKEQSREFIISEFGEKEIDGIIKQLESSIGKLDKAIKNRIKESSQGLPWLTKKLCIHILEQINSGLKKDKLIESNLNIKDLFEKDKERIEPEELKGLKLIAQRAYDGNFFDISEVGDTIESSIIDSLLNKRLIIKSGANYNIYWDIFRDYLVTNIIPPIGESFLLRQRVKLCLEVFLLFKNFSTSETIDSLLKKHIKNNGKKSFENILAELRNIGLVQKNDDKYKISKKDIVISEEGFKSFITEKFQNYTPYIVLKKSKLTTFNKDEINSVLKGIFKQDFKEKTWDNYSLNLMSWFRFSNLEIKSKIDETQKGRRSISKLKDNNTLPRHSLKEMVNEVKSVSTGNEINSLYIRDFLLLDLITTNKQPTTFLKKLLNEKPELISDSLKKKIETNPKIVSLRNLVLENNKIKSKEVIEKLPADFFDGKAHSSKLIYASTALSWVKD